MSDTATPPLDLDQLNALDEPAARAALLDCCGAPAFADAMLAARPFASMDELLHAAEQAQDALDRDQWLLAFARHPRIGERSASAWSQAEQSGAAAAPDAIKQRLLDGNVAYEHRFGHVFLICATGRSGDEMAAELERRLGNDADTEFAEAVREHRAITRIRLKKLVSP